MTDTTKQPPRLSFWMKSAYGFGSVAYGVKNNGFDYFLLLFYSQVIGLDARLVGIAITTALVFDALSDPIVGYWSDNLRSRWGRRHPFMYVSMVPVALSYFLLWNPPLEWTETGLFWYLLVLAVFIRTFITLYETPSSALAPELTDDYFERSSLLSFRYYFGWTGGNAMTVMMFFFIFPALATAAIPDGRFNRESYEILGITGSALIFVSILVSALGTHSRIPHLKPPPAARRMTLGTIFREIFETLANRSFVALFIGALLGAIATGLAAALSFFFSTVTFIRKSVQGLGLMVASFVLYLADFPAGATADQVSDETVWLLGAYYVPAILALWLSMMAVISMYQLNQDEHEENLRQLAANRS